MPSFLGFPYVNPLTIRSNQPSFTSDTTNLKRQSVRTGAQRWDLTIGFKAGLRSNMYGEFMAHYMTNGESTSFYIDAPQNPGVEDARVLSNTPRVNGLASAGDSAVTIDGGTFTLPAGLLITFDDTGHDKVYMVTKTLVGAGELQISPDLTEDVADNTTITATDVQIRVYHNAVNSSTTYSADSTQTIAWSFIEAL